MSTSDSYILQEPESSNDQDDIDSLPSSIDSSDLDSEDQSDAQAEWEASLQQLELILTMVIVPYAGKYFGRKFAYWSWSRYMEWMYPVKIGFTSERAFKAAGAVEAAAML
ncbi:Transcripts altered in meiosis protein 7 [Hyphodiscus hymeniophilus]|uniref:Transcripts altered in meiosis protein 7 n=1 Tax=Hyphodiscus hymeniophilus TaxID=353542 RepID=A0A9P7B0N5_9HELO|nr:Transcripts altered in meiosis protein 7 [Hyphodiscus hymeniophilus]